MHELAQKYLEEKKTERAAQKQKETEAFLLREGLYEKIYNTSGDNYSHEFPFYDSEKGLYYKKEYISVTEEEYEELKKHSQAPAKESENNAISIIFSTIAGIIYGLGLVIGLLIPLQNGDNWAAFSLPCWAFSFFSGTVFLGFAEILKLLHNINIAVNKNNE